MQNKLIAYFSSLTTLSNEEKEALEKSMEIQSFAKNSFLVKEGQKNINTFFVLQGLVRQFKLVNGEEISTYFYSENNWIIPLTSFVEQTNSGYFLQCLEDTDVVVGNEEKAQILFKHFPRFETLSRVVMEKAFTEQQNMFSSYITDSPEERYLKLMQSSPNLLQRVPLYQLASFIGVKPESLSRIRKRMANKR